MADKKISVSADDVIAGLVQRGMPQHIAEGFALNAGDESGFNPTAVGDNGNAFGIFQWNGERMRNLQKFAREGKKDISALDTQLDFVMHENATYEAGAWKRISRTTTRGEAAAAIVNLWERPAEVHRRRREAAYLGGLVPRGEYTGEPSVGPLPQVTAAGGDAEAQQGRMSQITDPTQVNGMDISEVGTVPGVRAASEWEREDAQAATETEASGFWGMTGDAIDEQWVVNNMLRQMGKESFTPVAGFQFDEPLWKEVTAGLPTEYHDVFEGAVSPEHARALAASTRESYERDRNLAQWGLVGVGAQIGASLVDPAAIAVTAATEATAAPVIYGAKLTKLSRAIRAGLVASASNVALDSYLISQDPVGDWSNLTYSAAAGFLLGGAAGAFRKSPVDAEFSQHMRLIEKNEGRVTDQVTPQAVPQMADGTLSAASVTPLQAVPTDVGRALEVAGDAPSAVFGKVRIDIVGSLKTSENPLLRWVAERLDEDAVGNRPGVVTATSAMEIKARAVKNANVRFYRDHAPAFKAWAKANGKGMARLYDPAVRAEFNGLVAKAVRRPLDASADPHVQKVASRLKVEFADLLRVGREGGVKGFDSLQPNDLYLTRQWDAQKFDDFIEQYTGGVRGSDRAGPLYRMIADSMIEGSRKANALNPGRVILEAEDALDLAKALVTSVRSRKYQAFDMERGLAGHDMDAMREMLLDSGIAIPRVDELLKKLDSPTSPDTGKLNVARQRIELDETWVDRDSGLAIEDFLNNDVESLYAGYVDGVMGEAAYQRVFRELGEPDANGVTYAPSYSTLKRLIAASNQGPAKKGKAEMANLDILYRALKGIPQEADQRWHDYARRARSWNFVRVMGQLGVAQLSELGMILGNGGMRGMLYHMPRFRDFVLRSKTGTHAPELMDELEAILSPGMDVLAHSPHVRLDDGTVTAKLISAGKSTKTQKMDYMLNNAKSAVGVLSGMTHINRMLQRWNARVLTQRFVDDAFGQVGMFSRNGISEKRYAALGIDPAMAERIRAEMRSKVTTVDGLLGRKAKLLNIESWTDIDAKNAFINGLHRWSRRSVQENSVGSMPAVMSKEMGKTVGQFRSFMLGAYTKQLLAGMHMRDWETFSSFAASMFFGGLFYVGQTHVNSLGRSDRETWLEERLSPDAIAKAAFQRAGFSTFLPMLVDMGAAPFTDEPIFAYRTTDLSTGIFGNPTLDLMDNVTRGIRGSLKALASDDYEFSQQDARAITSTLPLQNAFGIRNMLALVFGELPRFSQ